MQKVNNYMFGNKTVNISDTIIIVYTNKDFFYSFFYRSYAF